MQSVLDRLVEKIQNAAIDLAPSDNIFMENVFSPDIYAEILSKLPAEKEYQFIDHPDAVLADGTRTRKLLDLTEENILKLKTDNQSFWREMKNVFISKELQTAIVKKFEDKLRERFRDQLPEMVTVPIFYRDYPGYRINIHTDAPYKIATLQFYFPEDESQIHLGTSFHQRCGEHFYLYKTNLFKPNSAYAFARTESSWHSVQQIGQKEVQRNTLALTVYLKGHEYTSTKSQM
jgi:hypothetical protein